MWVTSPENTTTARNPPDGAPRRSKKVIPIGAGPLLGGPKNFFNAASVAILIGFAADDASRRGRRASALEALEEKRR